MINFNYSYIALVFFSLYSAIGPFSFITLTVAPLLSRCPSSFFFSNSARVSPVNPCVCDSLTFCCPGSLFLARRRASSAAALCCAVSFVLTLTMFCPENTLAALPYGLPKEFLIPVCSLSAPAQVNILLILSTLRGCGHILMWKLSFPTTFTMCLLAAIRALSSASLEMCSSVSETKLILRGKLRASAFLFPKSWMANLLSGTPLQNLLFMYAFLFNVL